MADRDHPGDRYEQSPNAEREQQERRERRGDGGWPGEQDSPKPNFRSLAAFIAEFRPISYAVAGLMREGSLYTLTGRTGEGKTAFLVILALAVATGRGELIGRKVNKGRVAYATAENPDDLRMRFMVACFVLNIEPEIVGRDIIISDNRVAPEDIRDWLRADGGDFTLIIVDTWQAFFDGNDANSPTQAVDFTRRFRPLKNLRGSPVVIIAAHPVKRAGDDNLLPYGGGGTLNEVDGNFTLHLEETGLYRFHWLSKIRGQAFDPIYFRIDRDLDSPEVVTVERARVKIPVMFPVDEEAVEARSAAMGNRDFALLKALDANSGATAKVLAAAANIPLGSVARRQVRLAKRKFMHEQFGKWVVTKAGKDALKEALGGRVEAELTRVAELGNNEAS